MKTREPVTIIAAITAFVISIIDFLVLMDLWAATAEQVAGAHLLVGNAAIAVGAWLARNRVTPLSDPRNDEGVELVAEIPPAAENPAFTRGGYE